MKRRTYYLMGLSSSAIGYIVLGYTLGVAVKEMDFIIGFAIAFIFTLCGAILIDNNGGVVEDDG